MFIPAFCIQDLHLAELIGNSDSGRVRSPLGRRSANKNFRLSTGTLDLFASRSELFGVARDKRDGSASFAQGKSHSSSQPFTGAAN